MYLKPRAIQTCTQYACLSTYLVHVTLLHNILIVSANRYHCTDSSVIVVSFTLLQRYRHCILLTNLFMGRGLALIGLIANISRLSRDNFQLLLHQAFDYQKQPPAKIAFYFFVAGINSSEIEFTQWRVFL